VDAPMKLASLRWADDSNLLITVRRTHKVIAEKTRTYEFWRTLSASIPTGKLEMLLMRDNSRQWVTGATLVAHQTAEPGKVVMSSWDFSATARREEIGTRLHNNRRDSGWVHNLYLVDLQSGEGKRLEQGSPFTDEWVVDAAGSVIARGEWDAKRGNYRVLCRSGGGWKTAFEQTGSGLTLAAISADSMSALAIGQVGDSGRNLWRVPCDGGAPQVVVSEPPMDLESFVLDPMTGAVAGARAGGDAQRRVWIDKSLSAKEASLARAFPGKPVSIQGRSRDGKRVLARVSGPVSAPTYYLVDDTTRKAEMVGESYPRLTEASLGEVRALTYTARDGAKIPAYLTLPPGGGGKDLPLVVLPHGGPQARDDFDFDWWAQFLASRGYAVLQPQFRGSTGFGDAHRRAGYREWGGIMQHDVTDGVKHLISQGVARADRICIVGASYGGYAALAGAAFTPELYRCAVSVAGVSDLPAFIGYVEKRSADGDESDAVSYWTDHIGPKLDPNVAKASPAKAAAAVQAEVLLIHGIDDTVVPLSQSVIMQKALEEEGKAVKLLKLLGEDHWLSRSETRVRMLVEIEAFLRKHLGT
jgi:cephalosporin-C deacetylase-like acetyl esterase